mmetsp:Transcript_8212/g.23605  ORF Transcript_8212/g.23605 Transcript_8212/m.23605 type:complete len:266 (+) Transcript_8212:1586-2383(+)
MFQDQQRRQGPNGGSARDHGRNGGEWGSSSSDAADGHPDGERGEGLRQAEGRERSERRRLRQRGGDHPGGSLLGLNHVVLTVVGRHGFEGSVVHAHRATTAEGGDGRDLRLRVETILSLLLLLPLLVVALDELGDGCGSSGRNTGSFCRSLGRNISYQTVVLRQRHVRNGWLLQHRHLEQRGRGQVGHVAHGVALFCRCGCDCCGRLLGGHDLELREEAGRCHVRGGGGFRHVGGAAAHRGGFNCVLRILRLRGWLIGVWLTLNC